MSRPVLLCADDFGADAEADAAMLRLAGAGRLSGISCLTDAPGWLERGSALYEHAGDLHLGLHFNLTQPFGYGERPLDEWIVRSVVGAVNRAAVQDSLERQLESYASGSRRDPTMEPIARGLSPELRAAAAAHYARLNARATARASGVTAPWAERGRLLATAGDQEKARLLGPFQKPAARAAAHHAGCSWFVTITSTPSSSRCWTPASTRSTASAGSPKPSVRTPT